MIHKIQREDKESFLAMTKAFCQTDAVLHPIPDEYIEQTFDVLLSNGPYADAYIAETDDQVAGYILLALTYSNEAGGMVLWIEELYVRSEFRGRGIGKAMLAFVENQYDGKPARIRLEAEEGNTDALRLYEQCGFRRLNYLQMYKSKNDK